MTSIAKTKCWQSILDILELTAQHDDVNLKGHKIVSLHKKPKRTGGIFYGYNWCKIDLKTECHHVSGEKLYVCSL